MHQNCTGNWNKAHWPWPILECVYVSINKILFHSVQNASKLYWPKGIKLTDRGQFQSARTCPADGSSSSVAAILLSAPQWRAWSLCWWRHRGAKHRGMLQMETPPYTTTHILYMERNTAQHSNTYMETLPCPTTHIYGTLPCTTTHMHGNMALCNTIYNTHENNALHNNTYGNTAPHNNNTCMETLSCTTTRIETPPCTTHMETLPVQHYQQHTRMVSTLSPTLSTTHMETLPCTASTACMHGNAALYNYQLHGNTSVHNTINNTQHTWKHHSAQHY